MTNLFQDKTQFQYQEQVSATQTVSPKITYSIFLKIRHLEESVDGHWSAIAEEIAFLIFIFPFGIFFLD